MQKNRTYTITKMDCSASSDIKADLSRIKQRLEAVVDVLHGVDIGSITTHYISKFVLPSATQYRTIDTNINQNILEPDQQCYIHLFILHPQPDEDLQILCDMFDKYIGKVHSIRYVWSIRHQSIVICVRLQHWYVDKFSQIFRTELVIQQELNKHTSEKQSICITNNTNRHAYKVILGRRLCKIKASSNPPRIITDLNMDLMQRVLI
jgi:nitrate reductase alpha subunit